VAKTDSSAMKAFLHSQPILQTSRSTDGKSYHSTEKTTSPHAAVLFILVSLLNILDEISKIHSQFQAHLDGRNTKAKRATQKPV